MYTLIKDINNKYGIIQITDISFNIEDDGKLSKLLISNSDYINTIFWYPDHVRDRFNEYLPHHVSSFKKAGFKLQDNYTEKFRYIYPNDNLTLITLITDPELIKLIDSVALGNDPDAIEYIMGVILNKYNIKQDE